ncbi:MAG: CopG family transcriptional regulator [Dehalococcoidia bacterium]|nr:CopG family transcriptional regulator [Dehalococcoidia bacterium]
MIRTQIRLTEEQSVALKRKAVERGLSATELIRQGVDMVLADDRRDEKWQRARAIFGAYRSEPTDVARNHAKYLAEAYSINGRVY